jgi:fructose transport system ATP-binding protein
MLDHKAMRNLASDHVSKLGIRTLQDITQVVETLSGGQRQAVAIARAISFGGRIIVLDEPTAALGVRETNQVLDVVMGLREAGLGVILISHNMPNVFQVADRIHIQRLGKRVATVTPQTHTASEAVAIMTGATAAETTEAPSTRKKQNR